MIFSSLFLPYETALEMRNYFFFYDRLLFNRYQAYTENLHPYLQEKMIEPLETDGKVEYDDPVFETRFSTFCPVAMLINNSYTRDFLSLFHRFLLTDYRESHIIDNR